MLVKLKRSNPPGGPWMMLSETGKIIDFVEGAVLDIEGDEAWFDAVEAVNGGWNLERVNGPASSHEVKE